MLKKYSELTKEFFDKNKIVYRLDDREEIICFFIKNIMDEENLFRISKNEIFYSLGEEKYFDLQDINEALVEFKNDLENVIEISFYMKKSDNGNFSVFDYISENIENQIELIIEQLGLDKENVDKIVIKNFMLTKFYYVEIIKDNYQIVNSQKYLEIEGVFKSFIDEVKKKKYISNFEILIDNKNFKFVKLQINDGDVYIRFNNGIIETNIKDFCMYFYYDDGQKNLLLLNSLVNKKI